MTLKSDAKFEEKLTLGSKNDMRNLVNFNVSSDKSESCYFDKQTKFLLKNNRRIISHDTGKSSKHWRKTENWQEKFG